MTIAAIRSRRTFRFGRRKHLGIKHRGGWLGSAVQPHTLGSSAIRFAVAGLTLLFYLFRVGLGFDRLGLLGLAALVLGGAPTVLFANFGARRSCRSALSRRHAPDGRDPCGA